MSDPLTPDQLKAAFAAEGCNPQEFRSWRTHGRDAATGKPFGPVNGVVIHHTAGTSSLDLVYDGTSSLPGPLCHVHLAKNGTFSLISAHRANHAGSFAQNAHDAVLAESSVHPAPAAAEPVDGNDHYYGIEIENLGNGTDVYPIGQYVKAVKFATALCRAHGWTENSVIGHKEGTTRKIDPKGPVEGSGPFTMNEFRQDVHNALALPAGVWATDQEEEVALTPAEIKDIWYTSDLIPAVAPPYENSDWADGQTTWTPKYALYAAVRAAREAQERTERIEDVLAGVKAKVDALAVSGVDLDVLAVKVADEIYRRMAQ